MSHSQAENVTLPCVRCHQPVEVEVWIIVDIDERPDLLASLRDGTLNDTTCPACGHVATVNAPLLIFRPGAEPALLFCPSRGESPEQAEEQAMALVGMFRADLGDEWREEWLARGLAGVAREALPAVLGDDPATAAGLAAAHAAEDDVPPGLRQTLEAIVLALANEGVRVTTAEELQRAVEARPELKARLAAALNQN